MRKAIVTLLIGEDYARAWNEYSAESWRDYCQRHDYDLVLLHEPIDRSELAQSRSVNWQKLIALEHPRLSHYERVVWLDSDILVNPKAPCIASTCPESRIGAVLYGDIQDDSVTSLHHERWATAAAESLPNVPRSALVRFFDNYYSIYGSSLSSTLRFNTGVLVMTPTLHAQFLKTIYLRHVKDAFDKEQTALNSELVRANCYEILDSRFNVQVTDRLLIDYPFLYFRGAEITRLCMHPTFASLAGMCLANIFEKSYFYHSCGSSWCLGLLHHFQRSPEWKNGSYRDVARKLWNSGD